MSVGVFLKGVGGGGGAEVHVLDILAGLCNELSLHFNGARREHSPNFAVIISIYCGACHGKLSKISWVLMGN